MSRRCSCGKGYCSVIDGKCSNCRTKKEQQAWVNRPEQVLRMTVVNKHHGQSGIYIGRGSPLGNPFPIQGADTRDIVIAKYEDWLRKQVEQRNPTVLAELERIGDLALTQGVNLQCFCAPKRCHGDVIKVVLLEAVAKAYPNYRWSLG